MAYADRFKPELLNISGRPEGLPFYEQDPTRIVVEGGDGDATGAMAGPGLQTAFLNLPTMGGQNLAQMTDYGLTASYPALQLANLATQRGGTTMPGVNIPAVNIPTTTPPTTTVTPPTTTTPAGTQVASTGGFDLASILSSALGGLGGLFGGGTTASGIGGTSGLGGAASPLTAQNVPAAAGGAAQSLLGQVLPIGVPAAMLWMLYNASQGKGTGPFPYDPSKVVGGYVPNEFEKGKMAQYPAGPPDVYPDGKPRSKDELPGVWSAMDFYKQIEGVGTFSEQVEKFKEIYGLGGYTYGAGNDVIASKLESPEVHAPAKEVVSNPHDVPREDSDEDQGRALAQNVTTETRNTEVAFRKANTVTSRKVKERKTIEKLVSKGVVPELAQAAVAKDRKNSNVIVYGTTPAKTTRTPTAATPTYGVGTFRELGGGRFAGGF